MNSQLRNQLFNRWIQLESDWPFDWRVASLGHSVHCSSVDKHGNIVYGFYPPEEKLSSALISLNCINQSS